MEFGKLARGISTNLPRKTVVPIDYAKKPVEWNQRCVCVSLFSICSHGQSTVHTLVQWRVVVVVIACSIQESRLVSYLHCPI